MKMSKRLSAGIAAFVVAAFMFGGISSAQASVPSSIDKPTNSAEWAANVSRAKTALETAKSTNQSAWDVLVAAKRARYNAQVINDGKLGNTKKTIAAVALAVAAVKTYQAKFDATEEARWKAVYAYGKAINDSKAAAAAAIVTKAKADFEAKKKADALIGRDLIREPTCYLADCDARKTWRSINAHAVSPEYVRNIMFATYAPLYTTKVGAGVAINMQRDYLQKSTEAAYIQLPAAGQAKLRCYLDASLDQLTRSAKLDQQLKAYSQFNAANELYGFARGSWINRAKAVFGDPLAVPKIDWLAVSLTAREVLTIKSSDLSFIKCAGVTN